MSRTLKSFASITAFALFAATTACSDNSLTAPTADISAPSFAKAPSASDYSRVISQSKVGDTTVTVFVVGSATALPSYFSLGNNSSILFAASASSICDIATSTYGSTTWDSNCTASTKSVQVTAKTWRDAKGRAESDFQPAMRFVPSALKAVTLSLWDGTNGSGSTKNSRIDFRASTGKLVDESTSDASLASIYTLSATPTTPSTSTNTLSATGSTDLASRYSFSGTVTRRIKHFSGYTVTAD